MNRVLIYGMGGLAFMACGDEPETRDSAADPSAEVTELGATVEALQEQLEAMATEVDDLQDQIIELEESGADPVDPYTDADALAAIQNDDPWNYPNLANIQNLWSKNDYGYQFLENSRWTMDNRSNPPGDSTRMELIQFFHETPECGPTSTFADCNATAAAKFYINGPRITDHNWTADGFREAALRKYHTHASGMYMVSFGQYGTVTDYPHGLIAPSGIHLEPHGAHQAIRIDGTGNSGDNIRIDTTYGSKGIAIYASPSTGLYCDDLGYDCSKSYPLYLRGGTLHLEDLTVERSAIDARNGGAATLFEQSMGIEHFYSWHDDADSGLPVHCAWNKTVTDDSIIKVQPYSTSPDLVEAHSYVVVDVWGPGQAPTSCTQVQSIKTDAAGVYGYSFPGSHLTEGGFSVAILGSDTSPLYPGDWAEGDRPSFLFEVVEPL